MIKVGTDFSGIGAPEQALKELGIEHSVEFACDKDKYARQTYLANHSAKIMYDDITTRDNTEAPYVDLYCFGFPCQAFSISGKRKGFDDVRGTLFFNAAEYIKKHRPAVFLAENVKGLLSHDKPKGSKSKHGRTFSTIINILAKTVNGQILMPMYEDNLGYNVYYTVLNSKHYDVPQNRERIFIVGFRDDIAFSFPTSKTVTKRLADILESEVDEKYYLSEKMISYFLTRKDNFNAGKINYKSGDDLASTITKSSSSIDISDNIIIEGEVTPNSQAGKVDGVDGVSPTISAGTHGYALGYIQEPVCVAMRGRGEQGNINQQLEQRTDGVTNTITSVQKDNLIIVGNVFNSGGQNGNVYDEDGISPTLSSGVTETKGNGGIGSSNAPKVLVREATKKGYAEAGEGDSINLSVPNSKTRRGRVGVGVAQTLDTQCNQAVVNNQQRIRRLTPRECFRLQAFNDDFFYNSKFEKVFTYFQFVYTNFDINKSETLCNVKLKDVLDWQTPKNLGTFVLCTTKECQELEQLTSVQEEGIGKIQNVSIAIERLEELGQKECAINITKWIDCTETLYMLIKKGITQVVVAISEIDKENNSIEKLWRITWEENLSEVRLYTTLILLRQIMTLAIYTYAKTPVNTQRFITSTVSYEKESGKLLLFFLKMEYTKQRMSDTMLYKQAGNSITVNVIKAIISNILKSLKHEQ